ncbi:uncharacterized protein LOC121197936 isoform X1 [Toxotes jaculatrix]|uniref:uncharacterized protein LOC121197936 isoform X1 n=1 Tax=Toxotes jaculatrix TaxID=941984 RepID=UPI001B3A84B8|nr:uncharacterized protein LOC121197936 isoform X1 [Toxotes jaculatrix]
MKNISLLRVQENTMVKARSFSSGVRTQHVFGWVSILWFTSAVSIAGSQDLDLKVTSPKEATCGENVTLTCEASSSQQMDIKLLSWLAKNKTVCTLADVQTNPEVLCKSTVEKSKNLTLTLINVMPDDEGTYLCKIQSNLGPRSSQASVTLQDCLEGKKSLINESHAQCWFSGVYPRGTVHWFQENVNVTDTASTREEEDQHGQYKVYSEINVEKGNQGDTYNCSLWIPSNRKYLASQLLKSPGSMVKTQWICVTVGIMIVKFLK